MGVLHVHCCAINKSAWNVQCYWEMNLPRWIEASHWISEWLFKIFDYFFLFYHVVPEQKWIINIAGLSDRASLQISLCYGQIHRHNWNLGSPLENCMPWEKEWVFFLSHPMEAQSGGVCMKITREKWLLRFETYLDPCLLSCLLPEFLGLGVL